MRAPWKYQHRHQTQLISAGGEVASALWVQQFLLREILSFSPPSVQRPERAAGLRDRAAGGKSK